MKERFKPIFRSNTQIMIRKELSKGVLEAIEMLEGSRILLLADRNISRVQSFGRLIDALETSELQSLIHLIDVKEPDVLWIDEQVAMVNDFLPDIVLGIGGGSLMDLAKAVSVLIYNEGPAAQYQGQNLLKRPGAKKIMVPTTAGTGSEVTPGAVVVNRKTKKAIASPFIVPNIAILVPDLTLTMPPLIMAATGMDAITHCLESYAGKAKNPFAAMYAREGFKHLINGFPKVLDYPLDLDARLCMLIGSCMAGFAIFNTDTGACHSMAYPLGTYYNVPHGVANALLLPLVMEHNLNHGCHIYSELYDLIENRDMNITGSQLKSKALLRNRNLFN